MEAEAGGSPAAEREDGRKWNGCPCGESVHLLWVLLRGRKWQRVQLPAAEREEQGSGGGECPVMGRDTCLRYTGVVLHPACRKPCDCKRLLVLTYSVKTQEFEIRNQGPKMVAKATGRRGICHIGEKERSGF